MLPIIAPKTANNLRMFLKSTLIFTIQTPMHSDNLNRTYASVTKGEWCRTVVALLLRLESVHLQAPYKKIRQLRKSRSSHNQAYC